MRFAFTRLFLVISQTARGLLNVYSTISSPLAWLFWIGLGVGMMGTAYTSPAGPLSGDARDVLQGEFATKIAFLR